MPNQPGEAGVGLLKHAVFLLPVDFFPGIEPGWRWEDGGIGKMGGCTFKANALLLSCIPRSLCE